MLVSTPPQVSGGCFPFFPSTSLMPGSASPSVLTITLCVIRRIRQVLGESRGRVSDEEENEREASDLIYIYRRPETRMIPVKWENSPNSSGGTQEHPPREWF